MVSSTFLAVRVVRVPKRAEKSRSIRFIGFVDVGGYENKDKHLWGITQIFNKSCVLGEGLSQVISEK